MRKTKFLTTLLIILAIEALFTSCGPSYYLKRSKINERKAIALGAVIKADTIYKSVEVKVPGEKTTVAIPYFSTKYRDTVIFQDRIKIHDIFRHDTLIQRVECPDTVFKIKEIAAVNKTISASGVADWWRVVALVCGGLLLFLLGFMVIRR